MPLERSNSFHLLLSDDELKLLKLLAEREGLNASDYLRMLIRTMPTTSAHVLQGMRLGAALGGKTDMAQLFEGYQEAVKLAKSSLAHRLGASNDIGQPATTKKKKAK